MLGSGAENSLVRFGFNPQPEPPALNFGATMSFDSFSDAWVILQVWDANAVHFTHVPEPRALLLHAAGLAGLAGAGCRASRKH